MPSVSLWLVWETKDDLWWLRLLKVGRHREVKVRVMSLSAQKSVSPSKSGGGGSPPVAYSHGKMSNLLLLDSVDPWISLPSTKLPVYFGVEGRDRKRQHREGRGWDEGYDMRFRWIMCLLSLLADRLRREEKGNYRVIPVVGSIYGTPRTRVRHRTETSGFGVVPTKPHRLQKYLRSERIESGPSVTE